MIVECDDSIIINNELPVHIHYKHLTIKEFMTYQCLPIKFPGMTLTAYEDRLNVFNPLLVYIYQDFYQTYGYDRYVDSYIYITAKHRRVSPDCSMNRPGYHIDGFGETDVVNYIWSIGEKMKKFIYVFICALLLCNIAYGNPPQGTTRTIVRNNKTTYYGNRGYLGSSRVINGRTSFSDNRGSYGFSRNLNNQQKFIRTKK